MITVNYGRVLDISNAVERERERTTCNLDDPIPYSLASINLQSIEE